MNSFKGKKVFITGAGGFIGSHLAEELCNEGANVTAFVHYNALGTNGWLDHSSFASEMRIIRGDICDRDIIMGAMEDAEFVFHLAALIAIPYSYASPISYIKTNIEGTLNILQCSRLLGVSRLIHTSTSEVYGTALSVPITEDHPLQGQSPYSASKIGADKITESFFCSFDLPAVTVRPFNTFGPRQSSRAVIPTIISQCLSGTKRIQLGNLNPTRDLNYVKNTVRGFLAAALAKGVEGNTFNLGSGEEISIGDVANLIIEKTGSNAVVECDTRRLRPEKSEVERLVASTTKAKEKLNWKPDVSFQDGIDLTINWCTENLEAFRPNEYSL